MAVSVAALFVNPVGIHLVLYPLDTLLHQPVGLSTVQEWQPMQLSSLRGIIFLAVLGGSFLLVIARVSELYFDELLLLAAGLLNAWLGWYLLRVGKRSHSLILEADGKHVLTDSFTSFGVVAGLGLVMLTGWKPFDPLIAIAVALNILWSGGRLAWRSAVGLLDYSDPDVGKQIREKLDAICSQLGVHYHGVRFRTTGYRQIIEVHLLFPQATEVGEAHRLATLLEERLPVELGTPSEVITHLESLEDHEHVHSTEHYTGRPG